MAPPRKRQRVLVEADEDLEASLMAYLPLNDLHQPDPSAEDLDRTQHRSTQEITNPGTTSRSLFVRGIPADATSESLTEFVSRSFLLKHATVVLDAATKKSRGFGFVTLADPEDALRAREALNGVHFLGKKIRVDVAEPRRRVVEEDPERGGAKRSRPAAEALEAKARRRQENQSKDRVENPPKLIVRNLPFTTTDPEQLAVLFRSFGKIKYITLPKTPAGKPAGFGFVTIRGRKNAERALAAVNGKDFDGRTLAVDWAVEKDVWEEQSKKDTTKSQQLDNEGVPRKSSLDLQSTENDMDEFIRHEEEDGSILSQDSLHDEGVVIDAPNEDAESDKSEEDTSGTVFIRNIPFSVTDDDLYDHFRTFGPLRYARVVYDNSTGYSRGSGFVCFHRKTDAAQCCRNSPKMEQGLSTNGDLRTAGKQSLLENPLADTDGRYTVEGRVLHVTRAVDKREADRLTNAGKDLREKREGDKRRLYLLSEGTIASDSPLWAALTPSERKMREESMKQRQMLIQGNPSLHMSLTRLSIRNIPRFVTSKDLKQLAREGVVGFATEVKAGHRAALSKEELARGGEAMKDAEHRRKTRGKGIVSQAKVVYESKQGSKVQEETGVGRSRGYGFIEYATHRSALMGLRYLNGYRISPPSPTKDGVEIDQVHPANAQDKPKRLIVEFAIENAQVVARRSERENRTQGAPSHSTSARPNSTSNPKSEFKGGKRKRNSENAAVQRNLATAADNQAPEDAGEVDHKAQRNQIIGRKRAKRRRARAT